MAPEQSRIKNGLIQAMAPEAFESLAPYIQLVKLPYQHVLVEPNEPNETVCFLVSGLASIVATNPEENVEVAHVGREGMSGEHIAMLCDRTVNRTFMQIEGEGYTLSVARLNEAFEAHPSTRKLLLHYLQTCVLQFSQTALANARYSIRERLARWLLMVHDRRDTDDLPLTHDLLGLMLGVRRSGVTDQIHLLEGDKAIKATRGSIQVLSRSLLIDAAGGCYGEPEREYERLIGDSLGRKKR